MRPSALSPRPHLPPAATGLRIVLVALALAATGCPHPPDSQPRAITTLHMSGIYAEAAATLAAEFARETGIQVKVVAAPYLSLREKELTDLINRTGQFDVVQVAHQWEGEILPLLRPLDDRIAARGLKPGDFIPAVRQHCGEWEGVSYGLPMACDVITLLYRTDVFAARAAEFAQRTGRALGPPRTWDEYLELARFLNTESIYGNVIMGLKEHNFTVWSGILEGLGGRLVDPQWRPVLNSEAGVKSLTTFVEMFQYAPPGSWNFSTAEANALFLQGKGAMYLTWPSLIWAQLKDTNVCRITGKIGAAVIPGGRPQLSAWSLGISRSCPDPDAAFQWIEFLVNAANSRRLFLHYGKGSPRLATYLDPECQGAVFYLDAVLAGLSHSQARFRIPPSQELCDYLDNQIAEALRGRTSPQDALDRTAHRWREVLTETGFLRDSLLPPSGRGAVRPRP